MRAVVVGLSSLLLAAAGPVPPRSVARPARRRAGSSAPRTSPAGRLHPPAAAVVDRPRLQVVRVLGRRRRPAAARGRVRRRLGLRAGGPHQAGGEPARDRGLPGRRLAVPGGPGRAAGGTGARRDRAVGVRLERAPGRPLRRRLARRAAGDGAVRRRARHHGHVPPAAAAGRAPPRWRPCLVGPTWAWTGLAPAGSASPVDVPTRGAIPCGSTPTGRSTPGRLQQAQRAVRVCKARA